MTREEIAAGVLQGLIAREGRGDGFTDPWWLRSERDKDGNITRTGYEVAAQIACCYADALISELAKPHAPGVVLVENRECVPIAFDGDEMLPGWRKVRYIRAPEEPLK